METETLKDRHDRILRDGAHYSNRYSLEDLKRIAHDAIKATEERWSYGPDWGPHGAIADCGDDVEFVYGGAEEFHKRTPKQQHAVARFIAVCCPHTVLELIAEIEKKEN